MGKSIIALFLLVIVFGIFNSQVSKAQYSPSSLNCGTTINEDTYLTNDLQFCTDNGLIIGSGNITLDCQGHKITGQGLAFSNGITLNGKTDVTIKNCVIENYHYGIKAVYGGRNKFSDNELSRNINGIFVQGEIFDIIDRNEVYDNFNGIDLVATNNVKVTNNEVYENVNGIYLEPLSFSLNTEAEITENEVEKNRVGIFLEGTGNTKVNGNEIKRNSKIGLYVKEEFYNNIYWDNLFFLNKQNAFEECERGSSCQDNSWDFNGVGNSWSDLVYNSGYPNQYNVPGNANNVDNYPRTSCNSGTFARLVCSINVDGI